MMPTQPPSTGFGWRQLNRTWATPVLATLWLGCLMAWALIQLAGLHDREISFDVMHTYIPGAKHLLAQGLGFLLQEQSYRVAPLGYVWPAIWQADALLTRTANGALFLLCIPLVWRITHVLGGRVAAVVASLLFALHPLLYTYFSLEMTEGLFIFGFLLLLWGIAEVVIAVHAVRIWTAVGATGLAITLLSRPVFLLLAPTLLAGLLAWAVASKRRNIPMPRPATALAWMIFLGSLLPGAVIVKNGVTFDVWAVATGAGAGLYQGVHPLLQGTEPDYWGLYFDINAMSYQTGGDHLHRDADRVLRTVAAETTSQMGVAEALRFFGRKTWWWMFQHPVAMSMYGSVTRSSRVFENLAVVSALAVLVVQQLLRRRRQNLGLVTHASGHMPRTSLSGDQSRRRAWALVCLSVVFVAYFVQFVPVLYNIRYSTAMLEPWLILLTGLGVAVVLAEGADTGAWLGALASNRAAGRAFGVAVALGWICFLLVLSVAFARGSRHWDRPALDARTMGPTWTMIDQASIGALQGLGATKLDDARWHLDERGGSLSFVVEPPKEVTDPYIADGHNDVWVLRFAVKTDEPLACRTALLALSASQPTTVDAVPPVVPLTPDGLVRDHVIRATHEMRPSGPATLTIRFDCPPGSTIEWKEASLKRSMFVLERRLKSAQHIGPAAVEHPKSAAESP